MEFLPWSKISPCSIIGPSSARQWPITIKFLYQYGLIILLRGGGLFISISLQSKLTHYHYMLFPKTIRGRVLYTSSSSYYGFQFALVSRISSFTPSSGGPLYVTVSPRRHPPLRYNYIHSGAAERQCLSSYLKMGGGALHFIFIIDWCWAHSWSSYSSSLSAKDHVQRHIIISCVYSPVLCELLRHTESEPQPAKPKGNHNNSVPTSQI